jgi:hypothetical protein
VNYNEKNNINIWNCNNGGIDINYLIYLLNKENKTKLSNVEKYKVFRPISDTSKASNTKTFISKYLTITENEFNNNSTIIIKSCTGTGKTTATARAIKLHSSTSKPKKVLSIVSKQKLASQHIKSFNDAGIELTSYKDDDKRIKSDNMVVCINSIMILKDIPVEEFKNYIVYIDEISSFTTDITHNSTLQNNLKLCYSILMRIIKHAHKVILSDANINDSAFQIIHSRINDPTIFINNDYKKYFGVNAVRHRNESNFLKQMIENVKNSKYFLAASDSCEKITKLYHKCLSEAKPEDRDKFILITSESKFELYDASVQFKDKFVFYSPSIIFGVDFSIDVFQDVFIYNEGGTISPASIFQQTTRTRNILKLYYYSEVKCCEPKFESLSDCKEFYRNISTTSKELNAVCIYLDENDDDKLIENTFFELFCYNAYMFDIYRTNPTIHFEEILRDNGFEIETIGVKQKISKSERDEMSQIINDIKEETFNQLITVGYTSDESLVGNIEFLNLPIDDIQLMIKHKELLLNKFNIDEHFNIIRLLKDENFINAKIEKLEFNSFNIVNLNSSY